MATYTIPAKQSNTGSIHDIASGSFDRDIVFASGCKFAVVLASYYGGKGYTTHRTEKTAARASKRVDDFSHRIIDTEGNEYNVSSDAYADTLTLALANAARMASGISV